MKLTPTKKSKVLKLIGRAISACEKCGGAGGTPGPCPTGGAGGKPTGYTGNARKNQEKVLKSHGYKETSMMSGIFEKTDSQGRLSRTYLQNASTITSRGLKEQHNWTHDFDVKNTAKYDHAFGSGSKSLNTRLEAVHGKADQ